MRKKVVFLLLFVAFCLGQLVVAEVTKGKSSMLQNVGDFLFSDDEDFELNRNKRERGDIAGEVDGSGDSDSGTAEPETFTTEATTSLFTVIAQLSLTNAPLRRCPINTHALIRKRDGRHGPTQRAMQQPKAA